MTARKMLRLAVGLAVLLAALAVVGCNTSTDEKNVSKEDRVGRFESDLDANDWGSLYVHIHPDNSSRNQLKSPDAWTPSPFESPSDWSFGGMTSGGNTIIVNVSSSDNSYDGATWTFTMKKDSSADGSVWYIDKLTSNQGGSPIIPGS